MHNFHHDGDNGFNAYGGNNHGKIQTSLLEDILELVTSLLMLNLFSILLMIIMEVMEKLILDMIFMSIVLMIVMKSVIIVIIEKVDEYHFNIANYISCVVGVKDKGRNLEKELGNYLKDLAINLSLNPSLICSEVSLVELELFLESYLFYVSIYGDLRAISFGDGLFLFVPCVSKCLSSHISFEESLLNSGDMLDPSYNDFDC
ncbi:hypothetical protein M9H77_08456 [Catharanthus roseus]|uniref:Uncharacterized protein n=1 Tax=Catharanthus roseus TaxID=4058 RepID=A0ACC0BXV4_CATRO|nr:hypothetical protein M9H77_08456 [Catharanthus roseus]